MARKNNRNNRNFNRDESRKETFQEVKPSLKERVKEKFQGKAKSFLLGAAYMGVTWLASSVLEAITDEYKKMDDK